MEDLQTVCVTGATGYIGSWLVKSLLQKGYIVHATVRRPEKALRLVRLWDGGDRLRLFKADLQEEGSFDKAVEGCIGVFHVAASMEFNVMETDDVDSYVRSKIIEPAINGTLNLLKSVVKSKSVKRVIFTSSISTLTAKFNDTGKWRPIVDEYCQCDVDHAWQAKQSGWVYVVSKSMSEDAAFRFAYQNKIDLVSIITTTVAGPYLTPNVPSSIRVLLSPIKGDPEFYPILSAVNSRMGSIALVHIEDICNAHIFLMEHNNAEGQYICCTRSCLMPELLYLLAQEYPSSNTQIRVVKEDHDSIAPEISSKKLRDLGFQYNYEVKDIIHDTVSSCIESGYLPPIEKSDESCHNLSKLKL